MKVLQKWDRRELLDIYYATDKKLSLEATSLFAIHSLESFIRGKQKSTEEREKKRTRKRKKVKTNRLRKHAHILIQSNPAYSF